MAEKKKQDEQPKPKRKMLTPQEKLAKLEAEMAATKAKLEEKDRKRYVVLTEAKTKLAAKLDETQAKIEEINAELVEIVQRVPDLEVVPEPAEG